MEEVRESLSRAGSEVKEVIRESLPDSEAERYGETVSDGDGAAEDVWLAGLEREFEDYAVVSEEGAYEVSGDPEYLFLVDPLDGSSLAASGESLYVTSTVAVLEPGELSEDRVSGRVLGSYCIEPGRGTEYFAWLPNDHASVDGRVRWQELSFSDPFKESLGPQDVESLSELENSRPGIFSNYSAKDSRLDVDRMVNEPLMEAGNLRLEPFGGSAGSIGVGTGRNLLAFEARPTKPTEAAGDIFAAAAGAHWTSMTGEEIDLIQARLGDDRPEKSYSSQVTATPELAEEVREVVELEKLFERYPGLEDT